MRHQKKGQKLNRNIKQRKALFKSLVSSLIVKEEIETTEAKAKAIKGLVDKLIYKGKTGSLHVRRQIMAFLPDKKAANKVVDDVAKRFTNQVGGFTKLVRIGRRRGDNTMMVRMELSKKKVKEASAKDKKSTKKQPKAKKESVSKTAKPSKRPLVKKAK